MNKITLTSITSLFFLGAALSSGPVAAQVAATVSFTPTTIVIDQGTASIDFFGTMTNPTGSASFSPLFENFNDISGSQSLSALITAYDAFGPADNLPAGVDPGTTTPLIDFFTVDTSALAPDTYSASMFLTDANNNVTVPANFSITIVPAPEPSALLSLALGAAALGGLSLRAHRSCFHRK